MIALSLARIRDVIRAAPLAPDAYEGMGRGIPHARRLAYAQLLLESLLDVVEAAEDAVGRDQDLDGSAERAFLAAIQALETKIAATEELMR